MQTLRNVVLATLAVLVPTGASAADLDSWKDSPRESSTRVVAVSEKAPIWTGIYLGVHGGGGAGVFDVGRTLTHGFDLFYDENENERVIERIVTDHGRQEIDLGMEGLFGGINLEYKRQHGNFVWGVFGDIEVSGIEGDTSQSRNIVLHGWDDETYGILAESSRMRIEQEWSGTVGFKAGFLATPNTYIYGLIGGTWAEFNLSGGSTFTLLEGDLVPVPSTSYSASDTLFGWTVGLGIETRLQQNVTFALEGRYTDFDSISAGSSASEQIDFCDRGDCGVITSSHESARGDPSLWTVRAALKYHFN